MGSSRGCSGAFYFILSYFFHSSADTFSPKFSDIFAVGVINWIDNQMAHDRRCPQSGHLMENTDVCQTIWLPEIRKYAGDNVPVMLIGTKEDLLNSSVERERIVFETARKAAQEMGCVKFLP